MTVPYENATSGQGARAEITKLLQNFGCSSVGFMDNFDDHSILLAFTWRGRPIQMQASAKGWAAAYLKENPYSARRKATRANYEAEALRQGMIAVNSILRDWVQGQVTAIETGMMTFDHVFMPHMLLPDGSKAIDVMREQLALPAPETNQLKIIGATNDR